MWTILICFAVSLLEDKEILCSETECLIQWELSTVCTSHAAFLNFNYFLALFSSLGWTIVTQFLLFSDPAVFLQLPSPRSDYAPLFFCFFFCFGGLHVITFPYLAHPRFFSTHYKLIAVVWLISVQGEKESFSGTASSFSNTCPRCCTSNATSLLSLPSVVF